MFGLKSLEQMQAILGLFMCSISVGFVIGQMSGMLNELQTEDSELHLTDNLVSWIGSTINVTAFFGALFAAIITEKYGRVKIIIILSLPIVVSWIMTFAARNMLTLILSRIIVGVCFGGVMMLTVITPGEYAPTETRGTFINLITTLGPAIGTALGHIACVVFNWRNVALIGMAITIMSIAILIKCVESPLWLASKGHYKMCKESFTKLHGAGEVAAKELQQLIEVEMDKRNLVTKNGSASEFKEFLKSAKQKYFWDLMAIGIVSAFCRVAGGKFLFATFAITMLKDITGSSDILLFTILIESLFVLGSLLSCQYIKSFKRKKVLAFAGIGASVLLLSLSVCLYLSTVYNLEYFPWINTVLLGLYFICVCSGVYPIIDTFQGEMFPLEIKTYCMSILAAVNGILLYLSVYLALDMFKYNGYHGTFLINAVMLILCLIYLWIKLPETKGLSLQEIEMYFKNGANSSSAELMKEQQTKSFL